MGGGGGMGGWFIRKELEGIRRTKALKSHCLSSDPNSSS